MNLEVSNLQVINQQLPAKVPTSNPLPSSKSPRREIILPIIKDLAPQYMSPHPPRILIPLLNQPIMAQHLRIEVKHLKRRMMDMSFWSFEEEKAVMIHELETAVQMHEGDHVMAIGVMNDLEEGRLNCWKNVDWERGKICVRRRV